MNYINYIKNNTLLEGIYFFKKSGILIIILIIQCFVNFKIKEQLKSSSKSRGIWKTEIFVKQHDTLTPILSDTHRWKYFIIDYKGRAPVKK